MIEEWKDIEEYEGIYEISNNGRVKSLGCSDILRSGFKSVKIERILKGGITGGGYISVGLCKKWED